MSINLNPEHYFSGCQLRIYGEAHRGDAERVAALLSECHIKPDVPGASDMTLLALAAIRADQPAITALVEAGADPFHEIEGAGSPAVLAINRHFNPPRTEAIAAFAQTGLDFNSKLGGKPYLFYFVDYAHWQGLEYALAHGGDVNAATDTGETLLSYVTKGQHIAMARWLVERGADPSRNSQFGDSPLRYLDFVISRGDPTMQEWRDLVVFRREIIGRITNVALRTTPFTAPAEARIAEAVRQGSLGPEWANDRR